MFGYMLGSKVRYVNDGSLELNWLRFHHMLQIVLRFDHMLQIALRFHHIQSDSVAISL